MTFNPEKSLFELTVVKWIFSITAVTTSLLIAVIIYNSNLHWQWDYEGANHIALYFKIPLGVIALGISLIGICGANHRSEQTKKQITSTSSQIILTRRQNEFSNYYKHIEEFDKYCEKLKPTNIRVVDRRALYHRIFLDSRSGDFAVFPEQASLVEYYLDSLLYNLSLWQTEDAVQFRESVIALINLRKRIISEFVLEKDRSSEPSANFSADDFDYDIFDTRYAGFIKDMADLIRFADKVLHFEISYESPSQLNYLANMELSGLFNVSINIYRPERFNLSEVFGTDVEDYIHLAVRKPITSKSSKSLGS